MIRTCWATAVASALIATGAWGAEEPAKDQPSGKDTHQIYHFGPMMFGIGGGADAQLEGSVAIDQGEMKVGDYWIGLGAMPVPPPLRAQLNLPEGEGLLVRSVYPDSPAKKAGVREYDVLLKVADRKLTQIQDLVQAVEDFKGKKLTLELIRGGKPLKIDVEPAKRPENLRVPEEAFGPTEQGDWRMLQHWLEQMPGHPAGRGPMRFRMFGPSAILPPAAPLPANTTVTIARTGSEPAKITVQQGDKKWEVGEKELDKLPAELRTHVERMLHGGLVGPLVEAPPSTPAPEMEGPGLLPRGRVERQLEEMNRRLEQLRHQVDELQGKKPEQPQSPAKPHAEGEHHSTNKI